MSPRSLFQTRRFGLLGLLALCLLVSPTRAVLIITTWTGGAADWTSTANWSLAAVPGAGNNATISTGTVTVSDARSVGAITFSGGSLVGTGSLTLVDLGSVWSGGNLNSAGTLAIAGTGNLTISGNGDHDFSAHTITNSGVVNWTGGRLRSGNGGAFVNAPGATFNDSASNVFNNDYGGATATFTNSLGATYNKLAAGTTRFDLAFHNSGAVTVSAGTLQLNNGGTTSGSGTFAAGAGATVQFSNTYAIADAAGLTGPGAFLLSGGTLSLTGTFSAPSFSLTGGTLAGTHTFASPSVFSWTAGNLNSAGTTTFAAGALLAITGSLDHDFNARQIANAGTVNWTGGRLRTGGGGSIANSGVWNDSASSFFNNDYGAAAGGFTNNLGGVYNKSGTGITTFAAAPFNNDGTVNLLAGVLSLQGGGTTSVTGAIAVSAGATMQFNGSYTVADASRLTGLGTYQLSAGTLAFTGNFSGQFFDFSGGTLAGTNTFAAPGAVSWTGGNFNTPGTTTFTGTTLLIQGASDHDFNGHTLVNNATINWTGGRLRSGNGGGIVNNAIFNDANASFFNNDYGGSPLATFTNAATGTYNKTAAGVTQFSAAAFNNHGAVVLSAGTLLLGGGGTTSATGSFALGAGTTLNVATTYAIADASRLTGTGSLLLSGGTLTLTGALGAGIPFAQTGGTLAGTQTFFGNASWTGGNWNSAGTTTINPGATLTVGGVSTNDFNSRAITNLGTLAWTSGSFRTGNGGALYNATGAVLNDTASATLNAAYGGATSTFTNDGTFNKNAAGTTNLDLAVTNTGAINVNLGTLDLRAGGLSGGASAINVAAGATLKVSAGNFLVSAPANLAVAGTLAVSGGTLSLGAGSYAVPAFASTGGTTAGAGSLGAQTFSQAGGTLSLADLTLNGAAAWSSGNWNSPFAGATASLAPGATLTLATTALHDFDRRTITNHGTIEWQGGQWRTGNGGGLVNAATGVINDTASSFLTNGYSGTTSFTNLGTYNKNAAGVSHLDLPFTNSGTVNVTTGTLDLGGGGSATGGSLINVAGGASLTQSFGNFVVSAPANLAITGALTVSGGTLSLGTGSYAVPTFTSTGGTTAGTGSLGAQTFSQTGGTLALADLTLNGAATWTSGNWNSPAGGGTARVAPGATLTISTTNLHDFDRRTITNHGTIAWQAGQWRTGNGGGLVNAADGVINDTASNFLSNGYGGATSFTNLGTYNKNAAGVSHLEEPITNSGTVNVTTGVLDLGGGGGTTGGSLINVASGAVLNQSGGNFSFADATTLASAGSVSVSGGTLTFAAGAFTLPAFTATNGTLAGAGTLTVATLTQSGGSLALGGLTLTGAGTWTNGDWTSAAPTTATIAPGATLTASTNGLHDFNRRTITNNGTVVWTGGQWRTGNGGGLINNGAFNDSADSVFTDAFGGAPSAFTNALTGTYLKTGPGTTTLQIRFNNSGTVTLNAGTLSFTSGGTATAAAVFDVAAGAVLRFAGGTFTIADGASLHFTGNAAVAGGTVTVTTGAFSPPALTMTGGALTVASAAATSAIPTLTLTSGTLTTAGPLATNALNHSGGTLAATTLALNGDSVWSGGNWNAPAAATTGIGPHVVVTVSNTGVHDFDHRVITNDGILNWTAGQLRTGNGGGLLNTAGGVVNDSASSIFSAAYGGAVTFVNAGTYNKTAAGTTSLQVPFTNQSVVNLTAGTLSLDAGGTATTGSLIGVGAGAVLRFGGGAFSLADAATLQFAGTSSATITGGTVTLAAGSFSPPALALPGGTLALLDATATSSISALTATGGTLTGPGTVQTNALTQTGGTLAITTLLLNGDSSWSGGDWSTAAASTATLAPGVTLLVNSASVHDFNRRTITNHGTLNWQSGQLRTGNGGSFINTAGGVVNDSANSVFTPAYGGTGTFTNAGVYTKTGAGTSSHSALFTHTGTLNIAAGTFSFDGGGTASAGSTINVAGGALLRFGGGTFTIADAAALSFTGGAAVTGGSVTVAAGAFSPP
ncbi:MAG: hypothetical protein RLZZ15_3322, partial [Verrucomicrobiota bacterium]